MIPATRVDLYQLTSLVPHHEAGLSSAPVVLTFKSRRLPRTPDGVPARGWILFAGLSRCLDHLARARFTDDRIDTLLRHPMLGPALHDHPDLVDRLRSWRFEGTVHAPREGTPIFPGRALGPDGTPLSVDGVEPAAACPYLVVETDLLSAKLIETPLLSTLNHMSMVATKASEVVLAAQDAGPDRAVLEFGTRRTHPAAAVDAAVAAYIGGVSATSNVEAHHAFGVPVSGTMDHFAVQAWERPDRPAHETEHAYFRAFAERFPGRAVLLVDTYDTFGDRTGIRNAIDAAGPDLYGIRIDSAVTRDAVWRARRLLDALGARNTRIVVSGGLDEDRIRALGDAPVDAYGVGERIVTSPDAPVGVGAIAKISEIDGVPTMKLSRGSGKASLPGRLQCWRTEGGDVVGLRHERHAGEPLLHPVWTREAGRLPSPPLPEVRAHAQASLAALSPAQRAPRQATVGVTRELADLVRALCRRP